MRREAGVPPPPPEKFQKGRRGKETELIGTDMVEKMPITRVLYVNRVTVMRKKGKVSRNQAIVAVGNGKGVCGIGKAKDPIASIAVEKATKRAHRYKNLHYFELYDNRTVWHDWDHTWKRTTIRMLASKEGTGLRVNNTIFAICECIGIKDLQVKVHNSRNRHNMVTAFWQTLTRLHSPEQVARKRGKVVIDYASLAQAWGEATPPSLLTSSASARES
eukprot:CAMPEP_0181297854 /NCGR_PEP_ID=MMETSP1101-20121128/5468_1 /TAXON_ID=46948 /ORGANISM="Rhodomonas abbreviata, Strain Caron Lab Isolate" /LENGTH=217 /DNA_ID=CAMNT_0023402831 /DNA_START=281 /DNA_END=932 /DNA_ORIENTATION=-